MCIANLKKYREGEKLGSVFRDLKRTLYAVFGEYRESLETDK